MLTVIVRFRPRLQRNVPPLESSRACEFQESNSPSCSRQSTTTMKCSHTGLARLTFSLCVVEGPEQTNRAWSANQALVRNRSWHSNVEWVGKAEVGTALTLRVEHLSHSLRHPVFFDVSFPIDDVLCERGGGKLARGKKKRLDGCEQWIGSWPGNVLKVCPERWSHLAHLTSFRMASGPDKARQHVQGNSSQARPWLPEEVFLERETGGDLV